MFNWPTPAIKTHFPNYRRARGALIRSYTDTRVAHAKLHWCTCGACAATLIHVWRMRSYTVTESKYGPHHSMAPNVFIVTCFAANVTLTLVCMLSYGWRCECGRNNWRLNWAVTENDTRLAISPTTKLVGIHITAPTRIPNTIFLTSSVI
jgi:hypothetical protein